MLSTNPRFSRSAGDPVRDPGSEPAAGRIARADQYRNERCEDMRDQKDHSRLFDRCRSAGICAEA